MVKGARSWVRGAALCVASGVGLLAASCGGAGDGGLLDASRGDGPAFSSSPTGCVPRTCQASGYTCGQNADGCGNLVDCGACAGAEYCGGGGFSRCGTGDGGASGDAGACVPKTCLDLGLTCGSNADGCGGVLDCGTCTAPANLRRRRLQRMRRS